jgi:hypothetical protein
MPATKKQKLEVVEATAKFKGLHNLEPWSCVHHGDRSEIEAYVMAKGDWTVIAEVRDTPHIKAEEMANYIAKAANDFDQNRQLIEELMGALELCLECDGITWEAEQEAEVALKRAKKSI